MTQWRYRRALRIDRSKIPGVAALADFPVMVLGTVSQLADAAHGGLVASVNEIGFYSDAALTTLLPFERVTHSLVDGSIEYHVQVPAPAGSTAGADTTFYVGYGNPGQTDLSNPTAVWDANYWAVYHFGDGTALSLLDSTSNARNLANFNGVTAGLFNGQGAAVFGGANGLDHLGAAPQEPCTMVVLHRPTDSTTSGDIIGQGLNTASIGIPSSLIKRASFVHRITHGAGSTNVNVDYGTYTVNAWNAVGGRFGSRVQRDANNGGLAFTNNTADVGALVARDKVVVGMRELSTTHNNFYVGAVGEARFSTGLRSDAWIDAEENNLASPSTFVIVGDHEALLDGTATGTATATGALTTGGPPAFAGTATMAATATGALATAIRMAGSAGTSAAATGALATAITLAGNAATSAAATGALATAITMAGSAGTSATATGTLSTAGAPLGGTATMTATATGALATSVTMAATASTHATATGALSANGALLAGTATMGATATGSLLAGAGVLSSTALATLLATANLLAAIRMDALATASAFGSGTLSVRTQFAAQALLAGDAFGTLTDVVRFASTAYLTGDAMADLLTAGARIARLVRVRWIDNSPSARSIDIEPRARALTNQEGER